MNIMIAYLSLVFARNSLSKEYKWEGKKIVDAIQTNEAAAKFYIRWLAEKSEKLDKIIYLCSPEVKNHKKIVCLDNEEVDINDNEGIQENEKLLEDKYGENRIITTEEFFIERIKGYCKKSYKDLYTTDDADLDEMFIRIDHNKNGDKDSEVLSNVIGKINDLRDENTTVYIDTTGGPRNYTNLLQLLFKFLTYKSINVEMPIYSELTNNKEGVFWKVDVYDLLKVLDGVNQFVTTGRSDIMKEALDGESLYNSENENIIEKILDATGAFSDSMLLCQTKDLDDILGDISESLNEFEMQVKNEAKKSNKLVIFENMIPIIREKFFFTEGKKNKVNYPEMVKWCLDNGLIQQALTIYVEKIPKFLNERIFVFCKKQSDDGSAEAEYLYKTVLDTDNFYNEKISNMEEEYEKIKKDTEAIKRLLYKRDKNDNKELCKFLELLEKQQYLITESNENENEKIKKFNIEKLKKDSIVNSKKVPKNNVKIFKDIMNNKSGIIKVYDNEKNKKIDSISKRTYIVENLGNCTNITNKNIKNEKFSLDDVKAILYSYIYAKAIRNGINHASDNEIFTPENMGKYIDLKYEGAKEPKKLTVENVKNDMLKAYKNLKKECEN